MLEQPIITNDAALRQLVLGNERPDIGVDIALVHQSRSIHRCNPSLTVNEKCVWQVLDFVTLRCRIVAE